jgi:hypothetical protein
MREACFALIGHSQTAEVAAAAISTENNYRCLVHITALLYTEYHSHIPFEREKSIFILRLFRTGAEYCFASLQTINENSTRNESTQAKWKRK